MPRVGLDDHRASGREGRRGVATSNRESEREVARRVHGDRPDRHQQTGGSPGVRPAERRQRRHPRAARCRSRRAARQPSCGAGTSCEPTPRSAGRNPARSPIGQPVESIGLGVQGVGEGLQHSGSAIRGQRAPERRCPLGLQAGQPDLLLVAVLELSARMSARSVDPSIELSLESPEWIVVVSQSSARKRGHSTARDARLAGQQMPGPRLARSDSSMPSQAVATNSRSSPGPPKARAGGPADRGSKHLKRSPAGETRQSAPPSQMADPHGAVGRRRT